MKKVIAILFILTIPIIDVFSLSSIFPLPIIFSFLWYWTDRKFDFNDEDYLVLIVLLLSYIPYIWSAEYINAKTFNHEFAMLFSIIFYYFIPKNIFKYLDNQCLDKCIIISSTTISILILSEFLLKLILDIDINKYIPHLTRQNYDIRIFNYLPRPRGTASESGIMAIYYEFVILQILRIMLKKNIIIRNVIVTINLIAYFLLISAASLVIFLPILIIFFFFNKEVRKKYLILFTTIIIIAFIFFNENIIEIAKNNILVKLSFTENTDSNSINERREIYKNSINVIKIFPFGIGQGIAASLEHNNYKGIILSNGQISLYLVILVSGGFLAFLLFLTWLLIKISKTKSIKNINVNSSFGAVIAVAVHYIIVADYWLPFFWVSLAMLDYANEQVLRGS